MSGASPLFFGCHCPVGGRVCSPVFGVEAPRSGTKLWFEVGRSGVLPLGKEQLSIPMQELSPGAALWCHLSPIVHAHKVHCGWHCPRPCLSHQNGDSWPDVPQTPCSQSHGHKSAKVQHPDLPWSPPGPSVEALRISPDSSPASACLSPQSLLLLNLLQAREGPIIHMDVQQVLHSQSCW